MLLLIILLPIRLPLYKIQRDGNRLQKFGCGLASGVGAMAFSVGRRCALRGAVESAGVHPSLAALVGRWRNWLAYSHRATDSGDARDSSHRSVFAHDILGHGGPALVRLG